jgi:hypothetical protein
LSDAAVRLAVDDHRIDGTPDIVNCGVTHEFERPGLRIDFHFANMSPIRKPNCLIVSSQVAASRPRNSCGSDALLAAAAAASKIPIERMSANMRRPAYAASPKTIVLN